MFHRFRPKWTEARRVRLTEDKAMMRVRASREVKPKMQNVKGPRELKPSDEIPHHVEAPVKRVIRKALRADGKT